MAVNKVPFKVKHGLWSMEDSTFAKGVTVNGKLTMVGTLVLTSGNTAARDPAPVDGILRANTETGKFEGYIAGGWVTLGIGSINGTLVTYEFVASAGQTTFSGVDIHGVNLGYVPTATIISVNGVALSQGTDVTASTGTSVVVGVGLQAGDILQVIAFDTFNIANVYTKAEADAKILASAVPMFHVEWWPGLRAAIPAGRVPADGQTVSRATYPDATTAILGGQMPVVTEANWTADPTQRGSFTVGDGSTTFRMPDYNGKAAGSLGAVFMRGDGTLSAAIAGVIQSSSNLDHGHTINDPGHFHSMGVTTGTAYTAGGVFSAIAGSTNTGSKTTGITINNSGGSESRPISATGCWVIKLFGAVVNPGSANAAQLATDYAVLNAAFQTLNGQVDFTIVYPNGGTQASPANIGVNSRYVISNPFPGYHVMCQLEVLYGGVWGNPGFQLSSPSSYGAAANQLNGGSIVVQTGVTAIKVDSSSMGDPFGTTGTVTSLPSRVKVWKSKGAV